MGKEVRQGILFVVVILVAVFIIDLGNSGVSGEAVNRRAPIISPTPIISPNCGLTDQTQHVLSRIPIPGALTVGQIIDPQDALQQTFIVVTRDANQNEQWSLYDFGVDGRLSNDDRVYLGGSFNNMTPTTFITSDGLTPANRRLFWTKTANIISSCNLPNCNNRITEASLSSVFMTIVPSLTINRIYITDQPPLTGVRISSCSRNQASSDWCGGSRTNFITHVTGILSYPYPARDSGFSYWDWTAGGEAFFSIGNNQVVPLPTGTLLSGPFRTIITPIIGGSAGLVLRSVNPIPTIPTLWSTELLLVDFNTGQSLTTIDIVAPTRIVPWFIATLPRLTTFFEKDWSTLTPVVFQSKVVGQPAKTVWTETTPFSSIHNAVPTASGNIVAMRFAQPPTIPQNEIVSIDCTP